MVDLEPWEAHQAIRASAIDTVRLEQEALAALAAALKNPPLGTAFEAAVCKIAATQGRVIVSGMGKSGIVGRKIAATMASTGTPSFFVHPGEASHGDLGMVTALDVLLMISWSGETTELGAIIKYGYHLDLPKIVITSEPNSTAARAADICLTLPKVREACPNQLAPTSSTTMQVVLGDALAVALIEARGFTKAEFYQFHPGGRLGAELVPVSQLMGRGAEIPMVMPDVTLLDATVEMSRKRYGCTGVVNANGELIGAYTDGDLRRSFAASRVGDVISAHMTLHPLAVAPETPSSRALEIMNQNAVSMLFVCQNEKLIGVVHMHDILRAGIS
ncbi:MAG: KpsF/GutQ family sugar-phosphate isomerase [Pseudomonadota bacterium]